MNFHKRTAESISNFNQTDLKILDYFLNNYDRINEMKLTVISKELYLSPNSIVRFAKKLGYSGFSEMKFHIAHNYAERNQQQDFETNPKETVVEYGNKMLKNMKRTLEINPPQQITLAVKEIVEAKKIFFFSLGISQNSSKTFIRKLDSLNKLCLLSNDRDHAIKLAKNMDRGDLAIFISLSGETPVLIEAANYLKEKKIKMISLTSLSQNYIQDVSDIPLVAYTRPQVVDCIDVSSRIYIDFLLDLIYHEINIIEDKMM